MAKQRDPIREQDVTGLKYFRRLLPLFERLHEAVAGVTRQGIASCTWISIAH